MAAQLQAGGLGGEAAAVIGIGGAAGLVASIGAAGVTRTEGDLHFFAFAVAPNAEGELGTGRHHADEHGQVAGGFYVFAVHTLHDVAGLEAGFVGRAAGRYLRNQCAVGGFEAEGFG